MPTTRRRATVTSSLALARIASASKATEGNPPVPSSGQQSEACARRRSAGRPALKGWAPERHHRHALRPAYREQSRAAALPLTSPYLRSSSLHRRQDLPTGALGDREGGPPGAGRRLAVDRHPPPHARPRRRAGSGRNHRLACAIIAGLPLRRIMREPVHAYHHVPGQTASHGFGRERAERYRCGGGRWPTSTLRALPLRSGDSCRACRTSCPHANLLCTAR